MNIAKQFIGEVHQMVKRWEQQILGNGNEERATTAVTNAGGNQVSAAERRPAGSTGTKSSSPPLTN